MWIVRLALRRPYTFIVLAIVILILGSLAIVRTPTDIFPNIDIPVLTVVFNYGGPSHIDTWDLKPDAPAEFRGDFKPIDTNVSGTTAIQSNLRNACQLCGVTGVTRVFRHVW